MLLSFFASFLFFSSNGPIRQGCGDLLGKVNPLDIFLGLQKIILMDKEPIGMCEEKKRPQQTLEKFTPNTYNVAE